MSQPLPATFLALDFETTGRNPRDCGIVEVAVARVTDGVIGERWSSLCNPGMPVDPGAASVHGITDAEIADAPPVAELLPELYGWLLDGLPIVAYNGDTFDRLILERVFADAGVELPALTWHDPLPVARALLGLRSNKLGHVGSAIGIVYRPGELHRAAADIEVLIGVTLELRRRQLAGAVAPVAPAVVVTVDAPPVPADTATAELPPFLAPVPATPPPPAVKADAAPLVRDALTALAPLAARVQTWIAKADQLPCETDADEERVINAIATFKGLARDAEAARGKFTDEIGKQKREIEAAWRTQALKPIEGVLGRLEALRKPLALRRAEAAAEQRRQAQAEADRIAMEARQAALAPVQAANDAALEAMLAGDIQAAEVHAQNAAAALDTANDIADAVHAEVVHQAAAIAPPPVRASMAVARDRIVWRARVVAPALVPRHLCSPDLTLIEAAIAAADGQTAIPGVEFEADVATSTRSRRG